MDIRFRSIFLLALLLALPAHAQETTISAEEQAVLDEEARLEAEEAAAATAAAPAPAALLRVHHAHR